MQANENPETAERLCKLGVDVTELYGLDRWEVGQILAATSEPAAEVVEGLILYNQLLIAMLMMGRATTPQEIARSAKASVGSWRTRRAAS